MRIMPILLLSLRQILMFLFRYMEIRIYRDLKLFTDGKYFYCSKIACPDAFDFQKTLDVFRSIYGCDIVVVFLCV